MFSLTGDVLTGDSEGNILTWGKSAADIKTLGKGAKGQYWKPKHITYNEMCYEAAPLETNEAQITEAYISSLMISVVKFNLTRNL